MNMKMKVSHPKYKKNRKKNKQKKKKNGKMPTMKENTEFLFFK